MCEATTIAMVTAAFVGAGMQVAASRQQQSALASAGLKETQRQGDIMRSQMRLQDQQREDALRSRKAFQENTLNAYTREGEDADRAEQQSSIAEALQAASARSMAPSLLADPNAQTGAVSVQMDPSSSGYAAAPGAQQTGAFRAALANALANASAVNEQQSNSQAALIALQRARQLGADRLRNAGDQISLTNAQLGALNRPMAANNLFSNASNNLYLSDARRAQDKGAGLALAGSALQSLSSMGYGAATRAG